MIPIIAKVAICLGIEISRRIISFVADQLSKDDKEKRNNLSKELNRLMKEESAKNEKRISELTDSYAAEMRVEIEQENIRRLEILKAEAKPKILELILKDLKDRSDYVENVLLKDIESALDKLKENKVNHNSALRYKSFTLLHE